MAEFSIVLRLPTTIKKDEIIEVKAKIKHPVRTGLALNEEAKTRFERFSRGGPAQYVKSVDVSYGDTPAGSFELNSSVSDDPIIGFKIRADREAPLRVVAVDYKGEKAEASASVKFSA